jgi:hypothetical protein
MGFVLNLFLPAVHLSFNAGSIAIISFCVLKEPIPSRNIIETKKNEKPLQFPTIERNGG